MDVFVKNTSNFLHITMIEIKLYDRFIPNKPVKTPEYVTEAIQQSNLHVVMWDTRQNMKRF